MKVIAGGGVMTRNVKGSVKAEGLVFEKSDPPLSKFRIKRYKRSGRPETLYISAGFRNKKVGLPAGNSRNEYWKYRKQKEESSI